MVSRLLLLALSLLLGLGLVEVGLRIRERADDRAIESRRVRDPITEWRMPPNRYGHDALGFRNDAVPEHADIVVLGDSQSWGNNASRRDNWPAHLATITKRSVYNMGMVAWGPAQYWALASQALQFTPSTMVVQLYLGNDFFGAYHTTYAVDHYASWRLRPAPVAFSQGLTPSLVALEKSGVKIGLPRSTSFWRRSAILQLVAQRRGLAVQFERATHDAAQRPNDIAVYAGTHRTAILLDQSRALLDLSDPAIAEGARLTLVYLDAIHAQLTTRTQLIVLLFPAKAMAFEGAMKHLALSEVARAEREAATIIRRWCEASKVACVDADAAFQAAVTGQQPLYPGNAEIHPTAFGYRLVAAEVAKALRPR